LTPEIAQHIVAGLAAGSFLKTVAGQVGVTPRTLRNWLRRGQSEDEPFYAEFARAVARAEAIGEGAALERIWVARNWQASAWFLERRWPQRYGRRALLRAPPKKPKPRPTLDVTLREIEDALKDAG
jgi:lambda repressor-like predicted transcriptional regulator